MIIIRKRIKEQNLQWEVARGSALSMIHERKKNVLRVSVYVTDYNAAVEGIIRAARAKKILGVSLGCSWRNASLQLQRLGVVQFTDRGGLPFGFALPG